MACCDGASITQAYLCAELDNLPTVPYDPNNPPAVFVPGGSVPGSVCQKVQLQTFCDQVTGVPAGVPVDVLGRDASGDCVLGPVATGPNLAVQDSNSIDLVLLGPNFLAANLRANCNISISPAGVSALEGQTLISQATLGFAPFAPGALPPSAPVVDCGIPHVIAVTNNPAVGCNAGALLYMEAKGVFEFNATNVVDGSMGMANYISINAGPFGPPGLFGMERGMTPLNSNLSTIYNGVNGGITEVGVLAPGGSRSVELAAYYTTYGPNPTHTSGTYNFERARYTLIGHTS